jgi:hypothetical protein
LVTFASGENRLKAALSSVNDRQLEQVQASLSIAMNMALSADRVELWDESHQETIIARVRAGLVLGLESVNGPNAAPETDANTLASVPTSLLFRIGYGRMLDAAGPARSTATVRLLKGQSGRVDGVDIPDLRLWAEWLSARHPSLPEGIPPATKADLERMESKAATIADLAQVAGTLRPTDIGIAQYLLTRMVTDLLGLETRGPLPVEQLLNVHALLIAEGALVQSTREAAYVWWLENSGRQRSSVDQLLAMAEEELAHVALGALEAKYVPFLWLETDSETNIDGELGSVSGHTE